MRSGSSWWIHTYAGRGTPSSEMRISWIRRNRWALLLAYLAYVGVLALTICYHEPWADEAQAWLIADAGPVELFTHVLRYEGSPGLWHLLLMGPAKAGLPYWTSHVLAGIIAAGGVFLLLRYSEIPLIPRLLLPFTFFLLYQYAVVARSYVLLPLLLGAIAIVYPDRDRRILPFTLLLCLLANANTHGMLIALALAAIYHGGRLEEMAYHGWPHQEKTYHRHGRVRGDDPVGGSRTALSGRSGFSCGLEAGYHGPRDSHECAPPG